MNSRPHTSTGGPVQASALATARFQIIVVGGGIVGKACALQLGQLGLRVALLAPPVLPRSGGAQPWLARGEAWDARVYALSASAQALLEQLRVWPSLDTTRYQPVSDMRVFGDASAQRGVTDHGGDLHFSAYGAAVPQLAWIVESGHIEQTLDTALRFQSHVTTFPHLGQALSLGPERAMLTLDDGRMLEAECVIGADGAGSWVRSACGIGVSARPYRQLGVVANFRAERAHQNTAWQWFLGAGKDEASASGEILALLPLPDNHLSMVWSAGEAHATQLLALDDAQLAQAVEQAAAGAVRARFGALQCVTRPKGFPLTLQQAEVTVAHRMVLIGDAAHVVHPLAGQGVNLGLRDVAELGRVFAAKEAFRDHGDLRLLRRYARARSEDVLALTATTDGLQRLFAAPGPLAYGMRNAGMRLVSAVAPLKRLLVDRALG
ncbi:UbiH/UbiF family hydroxylase [Imbroritus primus]|uniref:UbiH/UbiF family hydroxylase n=1 Tax=Imbroritus primus TaxID=3058603 RepID=UPI003D160DA6